MSNSNQIEVQREKSFSNSQALKSTGRQRQRNNAILTGRRCLVSRTAFFEQKYQLQHAAYLPGSSGKCFSLQDLVKMFLCVYLNVERGHVVSINAS